MAAWNTAHGSMRHAALVGLLAGGLLLGVGTPALSATPPRALGGVARRAEAAVWLLGHSHDQLR
jgi:hypothetical protein